MSYSYFDNNNNINKLNFDNFKVGQKWSEVKTNNKELDSIFTSKRVDVNQDGKIDENEVNLLKAFLKLADGLCQKPNDDSVKNNVLENNELKELSKQLNSDSGKTIEVKKGKNAPTLGDYRYIETFKLANNEHIAISREVNASNFDTTKLDAGKYYMEPDNFQNGIFTSVKPLKIQNETKGDAKNWSEGMNREIGTIRLADLPDAKLDTVVDEMKDIGKEVGFDVQLVHSNTVWVEDTHIRRHDGSVYLPNSNEEFSNEVNDNTFIDGVTSRRSNINTNAQGAIAQKNSGAEYAKTVAESDKVYGETYLEGGNVLNTLRADNKPGAIVGEESIDYTLKQLKLDKTETNVMIAKSKIAQDLNLKPEDVTYIPQFDFHIDMGYRQFKNGEISIPDYNAGIEYLENNDIESMDAETKQKLIDELKHIQQEIGPIINESEEALSKGGYKVLKVPCFASSNYGTPKINYMNGVAGTSTSQGTLPKGTTYYITNKSDYPEINEFMQNYLKENMGVDKTYFVSTTSFLNLSGGIDCLTEEYGKKR